MLSEHQKFIVDCLIGVAVAIVGGITLIDPIVSHFVNHILR